MKKKVSNKRMIICIFLIATFICGCGNVQKADKKVDDKKDSTKETWENRLYVPTMINKLDDTYFIIDCWNSRILYNNIPSENIADWKVLTDSNYLGGHTVASDGELFVFDNTDMQQILVYKKDKKEFYNTQIIENINNRPHCVVYDDQTKLFYVIGSTNGMLYTFKNEGGELVEADVVRLEEIKDSYVRSITIKDGYLYTVSGPQKIYKYKIDNSSSKYELIEEYQVPETMMGMNQLYPVDNGYLITINTDSSGSVEKTDIIYTEKLENLNSDSNEYSSLYDEMGFVGQPYFITRFDNKFWITEISAERGNGIKSFEIKNGKVKNIDTLFYFDEVRDDSKKRWESQSQKLGMTTVDLLVFMGQSNMSGKGDASKAPSVSAGWEYRAISDPTTLYPITEPFGLNENNPNGINDVTDDGAYRKLGGLVSAFANAYCQTTGVPIIGVSASEGNSSIDEWLPDTDFYKDAVNRVNSAKDYIDKTVGFSLRNVYMVWCQGENDGDNGMSSDEYYNKLKFLTESLVNDCGIQQNFVIRIGNRADDLELYRQIQDAQTRLCNDYDKCTLVSTSFDKMAESGMMIDIYHYAQEGYNLVGEEAGEKSGEYVLQCERGK